MSRTTATNEPFRFETQEDFFTCCGDYDIRMIFYELDRHVSVEELFQHFRARIMAEVRDAYGG